MSTTTATEEVKTTTAADNAKTTKDRLQKLQDAAALVRTGGKGSVRRKKKAVHKVGATDDKRLQATLKRLGVNGIPGIEEVSLFKEDGVVIHFKNPKVQASITANTYVVSGTPTEKRVEELLPEMLQGTNLNAEQINNLKNLLAQQGAAADKSVTGAADDEEVPPLVGTFEDAAKAATTTPATATTTPATATPTPAAATTAPAPATTTTTVPPPAAATTTNTSATTTTPTPAATNTPTDNKPAEPAKSPNKPAEAAEKK